MNSLKSEKSVNKINFKIFEGLYNFAKLLNAFPPDDPLEGIEAGLKIAGILNSIKYTY